MNLGNIKLPITIIGVIVAQAFGIIWYVAQLDSTVKNLDISVAEIKQEQSDIDIAVLQTEVDSLKDEMNNSKFDPTEIEGLIKDIDAREGEDPAPKGFSTSPNQSRDIKEHKCIGCGGKADKFALFGRRDPTGKRSYLSDTKGSAVAVPICNSCGKTLAEQAGKRGVNVMPEKEDFDKTSNYSTLSRRLRLIRSHDRPVLAKTKSKSIF